MRFIAIAIVFFPTLAAAQEVELGRPSMENTYIWKTHEDFKTATKLIEAKVHTTHPELIMPLLACIAKPGDKAVVLEGGAFSSTVMVTSGKNAGCRGFLTNEDIHSR